MRDGRGDDAAVALAVRLERPALLTCEPVGLVLLVDGADRLCRVPEGGIGSVDLDLREQRGEVPVEGKLVAELLLDDVTDHAFGLGVEHVERVRLDRRVRGTLERKEPT